MIDSAALPSANDASNRPLGLEWYLIVETRVLRGLKISKKDPIVVLAPLL